MKVVIIGASFAGVHCALRAKELYPYAEIILVEKEEDLGYVPSGLTLLLNEEIKELEEAIFVTKEDLEKKGIHLMLGVQATGFDFTHDYVKVDTELIYYDKLVLALGSSQISQKLTSNHSGFLTYKRKSQAALALEKIESSQQITVIGAGQTGMELASALAQKGKEVSLIESMNYPLYKSFDEDMIEPLVAEMSTYKNIFLYFSQTVKEIGDKNKEKKLFVKTQKTEFQSEAVFLATNVRPDLSIFEDQLECHTDQTLKVDNYFETSQPNVFAIGDLVQVPSFLLNQSMYLPLINNAVRSGQICADNLHKKRIEYQGAIRVVGTKLFGYYLASCGLTEADSFLYEEQVETFTVDMPVSTVKKEEKIKIKFTYNKKSKVLLGTQIISKVNILEKINSYALAIDLKMTLADLVQKDYFYHPMYANPVSDMAKPSQRG